MHNINVQKTQTCEIKISQDFHYQIIGWEVCDKLNNYLGKIIGRCIKSAYLSLLGLPTKPNLTYHA
jgi:hypothetical protein